MFLIIWRCARRLDTAEKLADFFSAGLRLFLLEIYCMRSLALHIKIKIPKAFAAARAFFYGGLQKGMFEFNKS